MRGKFRSVSPARRFIIDLMHASQRVPLITFQRRLDLGAVADARAGAATPPGWAAIFAKAFCLVARDEPILRTLFINWPWAHFYELPVSVGMIAIARREAGEDCVLMQKIGAADAAHAGRGRRRSAPRPDRRRSTRCPRSGGCCG